MKLYSEVFPEFTKRDTLFIHGNLASTRWWHPTVEEWRQQGSLGEGRLVLADWRGSGRNEDWPPNKSFTIEDLAKDFLSLMNDLEMHTIDVVGHSLGGLIALEMMALAPERFHKAFLLDPVGAQGVVFDESMYEAFRQMAASPIMTKTMILSTVLHHDYLDEKLKNEMADDAFKAVRGIGSAVLGILKNVDVREKVKTCRTPTLIVHGQKDVIIPASSSEALVKLLSQGQLEVLADVGHCWNIEDPKAFTNAVRKWL